MGSYGGGSIFESFRGSGLSLLGLNVVISLNRGTPTIDPNIITLLTGAAKDVLPPHYGKPSCLQICLCVPLEYHIQLSSDVFRASLCRLQDVWIVLTLIFRGLATCSLPRRLRRTMLQQLRNAAARCCATQSESSTLSLNSVRLDLFVESSILAAPDHSSSNS